MTSRSAFVAGAWRAQVHWVNQAWKVFCYLCTPTLFSSGSISTWRVAKRFFVEFYGFLLDNKSWCYLVFASCFHTLLAFILLVMINEYGLRQCYRFIALIYSCFALSLNQNKSNLAIIFNLRSKQALVFSHKYELSLRI